MTLTPSGEEFLKKKFALKTEPDEKTPRHVPAFEGGELQMFFNKLTYPLVLAVLLTAGSPLLQIPAPRSNTSPVSPR